MGRIVPWPRRMWPRRITAGVARVYNPSQGPGETVCEPCRTSK
jgi:hypothetical protein